MTAAGRVAPSGLPTRLPEEQLLPSPVVLSASLDLRRLPLGHELPRPASQLIQFDERTIFHDVFRDSSGRFVYFVGPMALNLTSALDGMGVVGMPSGRAVRWKLHHGVQAIVGRARVSASDTDLLFRIGGQSIQVPIRSSGADLLRGHRVVFTINKNNDLQWISDWARFYVREHGATAILVYDNGSTEYTREDIAQTLGAVEGLQLFGVVPWVFPYGWMSDVFTQHRFGGHWPQFAQPPLFIQVFRRFSPKARAILNVDVDEFVLSPSRRSIFRAAERSLFGLVRFNRLWVENVRDAEGLPLHRHFSVRKRGRKSKDVGKKWALAPGRSWLASWRAQPWTHQIYGWLNLAGSSVDFYCYHFIGISTSWYWDRTGRPDFDPQLHVRDKLLRRALNDTYGQGD